MGLDNFNIIEKIASGSYGTVYKANYKSNNNQYLAIKIIDNCNIYGIRSLNEIDILCRLKHPYLSYSIGITPINIKISPTEIRKTYAFGLPLAIDDVYSYIVNHSPAIEIRFRFLYQIASGMAFLHSQNCLHLDLKPDNLLIYLDDNEPRCVVSDFGLVLYTNNGKVLYDKELMTLTYRCLSVYNNPIIYSTKADLWSYCIISIYLCMGEKVILRNSKTLKDDIVNLFCDENKMYTINKYLPFLSFEGKQWFNKIIQLDPKKRLEFAQIIRDPYLLTFNKSDNKNDNVGHVKDNKIIPFDVNINHYRGVNYIIRTCDILNVRIETVFLAIDLYYSLCHIYDFNSKFEEIWSNLCLIVLTCFWMATKLIEDRTYRSKDILRLGNNVFTVDNLIDTERFFVEKLDGCIYNRNLFNCIKNKNKLYIGFIILCNPFVYQYIDINEWNILDNEDNKDNKDDYYDMITFSTFSPFYQNTEYKKWEQGLYSVTNKNNDNNGIEKNKEDNNLDYVLDLYNFDKSNIIKK